MAEKLNVAIIDYEMGNVKSIENAITHIGDFNVVITADSSVILSSDIIILPGVGAFPDAMKKLSEKGLISVLEKAVKELKKPTIGICLGMQLLFDVSEEKEITKGLGWIPGKVTYMHPEGNLRVPHIGWNSLILQPADIIFDYLNADKDFYFVHSLHVVCDDKYTMAKFDYGGLMTAAVRKDNVVGMQFHPEKSQKNGLLALSSFFKWASSMVGQHNA
ncbi:imidazole glycerol phosphate synthase subunit HisH [Aeromonas schubertii]|uniref:imidazole glycerol phosphate synthase subunit HisH n=1 Tax=Aeromonas schubertii TaxID=652 RepID=UPI0010A90D98|nr:imidazole glycerol phosphate synthase subunit HisH [Aeromonas schubertii]QCG47885.1 imidazole glycerol phosphate synthase subunit HisH [Aeromonas schubertii]